jgi:hypothetical protein
MCERTDGHMNEAQRSMQFSSHASIFCL